MQAASHGDSASRFARANIANPVRQQPGHCEGLFARTLDVGGAAARTGEESKAEDPCTREGAQSWW